MLGEIGFRRHVGDIGFRRQLVAIGACGVANDGRDRLGLAFVEFGSAQRFRGGQGVEGVAHGPSPVVGAAAKGRNIAAAGRSVARPRPRA